MKMDEINKAYQALSPWIECTPLLECRSLQKWNGGKGRVFIKNEEAQKTGSFKFRGAVYTILAKEGKGLGNLFMTRSSGNFGKAIAYAAKILSKEVIVVVPTTAPLKKVQGARDYGACVVVHGVTHQESLEKLDELHKIHQGILVSPFDDDDVILGQATLGVEIIKQHPSIKHCFCPVGGGGLMSGCAMFFKESQSEVEMIAVEPRGACDFALSFCLKQKIKLPKTITIADGLRAPTVGERNWPLLMKYVDRCLLVSDHSMIEAMNAVYEEHGIMLEPSGVASLAGWISYVKKKPLDGDSVCIASGGNIEPQHFLEMIKDVHSGVALGSV